jgi:pyrimidine operon attenuation protein/uracil phosphoribosyltransferase
VIRVIPFASCYVYSPSGTCPTSERSRLLRATLKACDEEFLHRYAARVRQQADSHPAFAELFGPRSVLIPVPGSAPRSRATRWVAEGLARALAREGLGATVWTGLQRVRPVRKSATADCGKRPTVATHYRSFAIDAGFAPPEECVLIDDVVTKGRTMLAAAARMHDAFPTARIRAFALLRTMGMVAEVERLIEPCQGEIRWRSGDAHRTP